MKRKVAVGFVAAALSVGMLPGTASAGQYCERAEEVVAGGGYVCRVALGTVLEVCSKVGEKLGGGECQLA